MQWGEALLRFLTQNCAKTLPQSPIDFLMFCMTLCKKWKLTIGKKFIKNKEWWWCLFSFNSILFTKYESLKLFTNNTYCRKVKGLLGIGLHLSGLKLTDKMKRKNKVTLNNTICIWKIPMNYSTINSFSVVVVVYIFRYFRLYLQKSIKKNKEEGRSGTTGTGVSQKDLQRGAKRTNKKCY